MDKVICVANTDAFEVNGLNADDKTLVIPNGVFINDKQESTKDVVVDDYIIGFIGNMGYEAKIQVVIKLYHDIFMELNSRLPDTTLSIIGRRPC